MKPREKEFCRLMALCGEPMRAAREAGYKRPDRWHRLLCRSDIAAEIKRCADVLRSVYASTAVSGLYRLSFGKTGDALRLLYRENPSEEELDSLDLSGVAEIKRTKDKSVEIKFFDRIKALDRLNDVLRSSGEAGASGGLLEAMRMSAMALSRTTDVEGDDDGI